MTTNWPLQKDCAAYYGDPRNTQGHESLAWCAVYLAKVVPPFPMYFAGQQISGIRIHRKCAQSLVFILNKIAHEAVTSPGLIEQSGIQNYSGAYQFRNSRRGKWLSMHAYGCAIDVDAPRNRMGYPGGHLAQFPAIIEAFEEEGWVWGGRWSATSCDPMHFQAARVNQ
jgi:hypothetical protein